MKRSHDNPLKWRQAEWLNALSTASESAGQLLHQRRLAGSTFDRWLTEPSFRRALRRRMHALAVLRELEIHRAAEQSARCLRKAVDAESPEAQTAAGAQTAPGAPNAPGAPKAPDAPKMPDRQTCLDVIKLARASTARNARRPEPPSERSPEQTRILRELEQLNR